MTLIFFGVDIFVIVYIAVNRQWILLIIFNVPCVRKRYFNGCRITINAICTFTFRYSSTHSHWQRMKNTKGHLMPSYVELIFLPSKNRACPCLTRARCYLWNKCAQDGWCTIIYKRHVCLCFKSVNMIIWWSEVGLTVMVDRLMYLSFFWHQFHEKYMKESWSHSVICEKPLKYSKNANLQRPS